MSVIASLCAFVLAAAILIVAPGLDTALVLRTAASRGARPAGFAALGIALGCMVWGTTAVLGLGALLTASPVAFAIVKWIGALYLGWLGLNLLLHPRKSFDADSIGAASGDVRQSLYRGLLTNLLNPKVGVFYISFLPQFVPTGANVIAFSTLLLIIHLILFQAWFAILIASTVRLGRLLRRARVVEVLDRITGGVFILFGAKLVLSKR